MPSRAGQVSIGTPVGARRFPGPRSAAPPRRGANVAVAAVAAPPAPPPPAAAAAVAATSGPCATAFASYIFNVSSSSLVGAAPVEISPRRVAARAVFADPRRPIRRRRSSGPKIGREVQRNRLRSDDAVSASDETCFASVRQRGSGRGGRHFY